MYAQVESWLRAESPLDFIESLANDKGWSHERVAEDELCLILSGNWGNYHLSFNWREAQDGLHLACAHDIRVPGEKLDAVYQLLAKVNELLWIGHFDFWAEEKAILFRYGLLSASETPIATEQCDAMITAALEACDLYYPAFQYLIWGGLSAEQALEAALFETVGAA